MTCGYPEARASVPYSTAHKRFTKVLDLGQGSECDLHPFRGVFPRRCPCSTGVLMVPRKSTRKLDATKRGELEIAAAVAREAVMQLHMGAATRLIELASDRVSAMRILSIYLRVHGFNEADATILSNRVLAQIGQRAAKTTTPAAPSLVSDDQGEVEADSVSLLRAV